MKTFFFFLLITLTIGCSTSKQTRKQSEISTKSIENVYWVLIEIDGEQPPTSVENQIYIFLSQEDNKLSGSNGCNRILGSYDTSNGLEIKFDNVATTLMACNNEDWDEIKFNNMLEKVNNFTISGDKLMLNVGKREPLACFVKVKEEGITNKYWKLIELEGKEVVMALNQEREQYIILRNDNTLTGFAGCNQFSGNYTLEEDKLRIRFNNLLSSLRICPDVSVNEVDFFKVLDMTDNYTIIGNKLMLNVGKRAPLAVFESVYF
ncbi:MAG: META domain-containing protein [Bacteroidales bacterium]|nr:META domain-containing protein [Bacteroidales bacterium]